LKSAVKYGTLGLLKIREEAKMDLQGKKVLVVGTGKSGLAAAELLKNKGIAFAFFDGNEKLDRDKFSDAELYLGDMTEDEISAFAVAVLSPGVPVENPFSQKLIKCGLKIWGEIELAYRFGAGKLVAITGTNGKTTTTALTGEIMKSYYKDVRVVGNIGIPYTSEAGTMTDETVTVAEISSFQLETALEFHPQVSAILNITPDHLDRHHTMECYSRTKEDITKNQTASEVCVLNYEDEELRRFGESAKVKVVWFSSKRRLDDGWFLDGEEICLSENGAVSRIINVNDMNILGVHNYENAMAACAMSRAIGVPTDRITEVLRSFQAVEHRIEYVTEKGGVRYYNDSKGTNPDAAIQGIRAMNRPTLLIGGGYDKGAEYDEWINAFDGKVKKLVLIGQTAEKIEGCAKKNGFTDTVILETLEDAVRFCHENAEAGDAVLLSPACASWGMFNNYEERGRIFKDLVNNLEE
jgi:UDP-N-acetylmuramoylalanine--D-glutamate ligase